MRAPIRLVRGGWPTGVERRVVRFVREDPRPVIRAEASPEIFRSVMSYLHVGDTIKITGSNRHPVADDLLLDNLDLSGKSIVDVGASDGTTSVDLIRKLPDFGSYTIADLYLLAHTVEVGSHSFVYDPAGTCVLVSGRRLIAWPALSTWVRWLYTPLLRKAARQAARRRELLLLNPDALDLLANDARVSYRVHDVFTAWDGPPPDVIKVANLLRRLYFSDDDIVRALAALHSSLAADGHLLIVDNPRIAGIDARAGLYLRSAHGFDIVAETAERPEITDLVTGFAVPAPSQ